MNKLRQEFPILDSQPERLAYLDSAASAQKPQIVIDRINSFVTSEYSNIHRGAYNLSAQATLEYERSRDKVADFINVKNKEIIFTRSATEGVNLVAYSYGELLTPGDIILLSELEHHSNIVPWQIIAERKGLKVEFVKMTKNACLDLDDYKKKLVALKPKLVSLTMHSNAFGTITPAKKLVELAHEAGALIMLDACQSIVHQKVDMAELDADFLVFSGHKLYGPTGVGVLYGRESLLNAMPPFNGGGDMIQSVTTAGSTWAALPSKFEAGTPAITEAIALGVAIDFVNKIGFTVIGEQDKLLTAKAIDLLQGISGVDIYGPLDTSLQSGIVAFNIQNIHPHDFATLADQENVQLRAGFHCAMPALTALGLSATARVSFGVYSEEADLLQLEKAILKAKKIFK